MTAISPLTPGAFQLPPPGGYALPGGMFPGPPNIRYGFGGAQSATTKTNKPVDPNGDAMPPTAETPRDNANSYLESFFGPRLTFEQQRTLAKDDEARAVRELDRLEAFRLREAENMFQYGFKSNLLASLLKDVPKAITAIPKNYNDVMQQVLELQRTTQPLLASRGGVQDFSSSFRTRA